MAGIWKERNGGRGTDEIKSINGGTYECGKRQVDATARSEGGTKGRTKDLGERTTQHTDSYTLRRWDVRGSSGTEPVLLGEASWLGAGPGTIVPPNEGLCGDWTGINITVCTRSFSLLYGVYFLDMLDIS